MQPTVKTLRRGTAAEGAAKKSTEEEAERRAAAEAEAVAKKRAEGYRGGCEASFPQPSLTYLCPSVPLSLAPVLPSPLAVPRSHHVDGLVMGYLIHAHRKLRGRRRPRRSANGRAARKKAEAEAAAKKAEEEAKRKAAEEAERQRQEAARKKAEAEAAAKKKAGGGQTQGG